MGKRRLQSKSEKSERDTNKHEEPPAHAKPREPRDALPRYSSTEKNSVSERDRVQLRFLRVRRGARVYARNGGCSLAGVGGRIRVCH